MFDKEYRVYAFIILIEGIPSESCAVYNIKNELDTYNLPLLTWSKNTIEWNKQMSEYQRHKFDFKTNKGSLPVISYARVDRQKCKTSVEWDMEK